MQALNYHICRLQCEQTTQKIHDVGCLYLDQHYHHFYVHLTPKGKDENIFIPVYTNGIHLTAARKR